MKPLERNLKSLRIPLLLFLGFFCLYMFTAPAKLPEGDEGILLGVADRIARHGFSMMVPSQDESGIFSDYGFFAQGYSKYGLGQSLLAIPVTQAFRKTKTATSDADYIFHLLCLYSLSAATGAGINVLFFLFCLRLGYRVGTSVFLTLVLGITTMVWPYSQTLFSDPTLALMWLLTIYSLLTYRDEGKRIYLGIAGGALGFAVLTKIVAAFTVPVFAAYFLYILIQKKSSESSANVFKSALWFFLPLVFFGWVFLWYNRLRYGSFLTLGYTDNHTYDVRDSLFGFNVPFLAGLHGLLLSSGKGFFFYNASALLGLIGYRQFYRKHRPEALVILAIVSAMIAIYSTWHGWHGDWSWGPRHISCLPPFFLLAAGPWIENLRDRWSQCQPGRWWAAVLVSSLLVISFSVQILGLSIKSNNYIRLAAQPDVFKGKFFQADWPVRDDSMHLHFIPEFSPLAGHLWMMRVLHHRNDPKLMEIYQSPPWISLNSNWAPGPFNAGFFQYNIWWLHARALGWPGAGGMFMVALGFLMVACLSLGSGLYLARKVEKIG